MIPMDYCYCGDGWALAINYNTDTVGVDVGNYPHLTRYWMIHYLYASTGRRLDGSTWRYPLTRRKGCNIQTRWKDGIDPWTLLLFFDCSDTRTPWRTGNWWRWTEPLLTAVDAALRCPGVWKEGYPNGLTILPATPPRKIYYRAVIQAYGPDTTAAPRPFPIILLPRWHWPGIIDQTWPIPRRAFWLLNHWHYYSNQALFRLLNDWLFLNYYCRPQFRAHSHQTIGIIVTPEQTPLWLTIHDTERPTGDGVLKIFPDIIWMTTEWQWQYWWLTL